MKCVLACIHTVHMHIYIWYTRLAVNVTNIIILEKGIPYHILVDEQCKMLHIARSTDNSTDSNN